MSTTEKRLKVVKSHPRLSLKKQCEVLDIHRSGMYYKPRGESLLNLYLMRKIDAQFTKYPDTGVDRMTTYLRMDLGHKVNIKRIRRLYRLMAINTIYCRPKTTIKNSAHSVYPYLLRGLKVERINQVWQTDITYIPLKRGFMYMAAIIDVYSRKILGWSLSNSMEKEWCVELLEDTIAKHGKPEIHNSDQGAQYTSNCYIEVLKKHGIQISMDGKGRALDNIYIERFWRSLKYEKIYLFPANGGLDLLHIVREYIHYYNRERRHTKIGKIPPNELYYKSKMAS